MKFLYLFVLVIATTAWAKQAPKSVSSISIQPKVEEPLPKKKAKNNIFARLNSKDEFVLTYYGLMLAGAIARSVSATAVHPLNVIKTILQKRDGKLPPFDFHIYSRGAGSQFIMSVPHGALNFAVTETTKTKLTNLAMNSTLTKYISPNVLNPALDFISSAISTFICSIVSTPQMVITDRIMAGIYPDFLSAVKALYDTEGIQGFYLGWLPALIQKIPSYALTWMFFQQLKDMFNTFVGRAGTAIENLLLGSVAAAGACCIMIPIDTIKTRIVTQGKQKIYHNMYHCLQTILKEEGMGSLYRALPPRLMSVVPMIGIQFAVYELVKRLLMHQPPPKLKSKLLKLAKMSPLGNSIATAISNNKKARKEREKEKEKEKAKNNVK